MQSLSRVLLLAGLLFGSACSRAHEPLPAAQDLRADGVEARRTGLPIMLYFYSRTCPYCREVEEDYLRPLLAGNTDQPRFLLRSVETDAARPLTGFDGMATTMQAFSRRQGVTLVPHLRFVGPEGAPLAPDLVGLTLRDFYGGYLEDSINQAGAKMR
jgi:hypothetical protein